MSTLVMGAGWPPCDMRASTDIAAAANRYKRECSGFALDQFLALVKAECSSVSHLLDVACAHGTVPLGLPPGKATLVALDVNRASMRTMTAAARAQARGDIVALCADAMRMPFRTASIDLVTMRLAFGDIRDPESALLEASRVLRRGGKLILCEIALPETLVQPWRDLSTYRYGYQKNFFSRTQLVGLIHRAHFEVEHMELSMAIRNLGDHSRMMPVDSQGQRLLRGIVARHGSRSPQGVIFRSASGDLVRYALLFLCGRKP